MQKGFGNFFYWKLRNLSYFYLQLIYPYDLKNINKLWCEAQQTPPPAAELWSVITKKIDF